MCADRLSKQKQAKQDALVAAGVEEFSRKSYADASTDAIAQGCGISKGLLFHYFASKKDFYLHCLAQSLEKLMQPTEIPQGSFFEILFAVMNDKLKLCAQYPAETRFVNMASREAATEVAKDKAQVFGAFAVQAHAASAAVMERALETLPLQGESRDKAKDGLLLYSHALINRYLLTYQNTPEAFFQDAARIQGELREYIELMLYGIVEEAIKQ